MTLTTSGRSWITIIFSCISSFWMGGVIITMYQDNESQ